MNPCSRSPKPEARSPKAKAFTLVEMLVVIFVIAILVAVVVGVAGIVMRRESAERTKTTMATLVQAVQAYYDFAGQYPRYPYDTRKVTDSPPRDRNVAAKALYDCIMLAPGAVDRVRSLPKDAVGTGVFLDAFGKAMDYCPEAGRGGGPLIQSAGPDGKWYPDVADSTDDIFSDGR